MTILKFKDFQGSADFEVGHILIQILHIDDFVTAECDCASEVQSRFETLVEEYLETCASIGKEPCRPYRGTFNVRVAPDLHKRAVQAALEAHSTLNAWIEKAMRDKIDRSANMADMLEAALGRLDDHVNEIKINSTMFADFVWSQNGSELEGATLMSSVAERFTAH